MKQQKIQDEKINIQDKKIQLSCIKIKCFMQKSQCYNSTRVNSLSVSTEITDFQYIPCNHFPDSQEYHKTTINRIEKKKNLEVFIEFPTGRYFVPLQNVTLSTKRSRICYTVFLKRQVYLSEKSNTSRKRGPYSRDLMPIFDRIVLQFPEP